MRMGELGPISLFVAIAAGAVGLVLLDWPAGDSADGRAAIVYAGDIWDKPLLEEFMRLNPDIQVNAVYNSSYSKLMVMIAGKTAPDVMSMGQSFGEFACRGAFLDITDLADRDLKLDEYYSEVVDWYRYEGRLYGMPNVIDLQFIAYNRDLFEQAGVPLPTEDWTLEEFIDRAKKLTVMDKQGRVKRFGFMGGLPPCNFGGYYLTPDNRHSAVNTPEMIEAVRFSLDISQVHKISPGRFGGRENLLGMTPLQSFVSGQLPIFTAYAWHTRFLVPGIEEFRWGVARNPRATTQQHWTSSDGYAIYRHTKHPEKAWRLVKFLVSPETVLGKCRKNYRIPAHRATAKRLLSSRHGTAENLDLLLRIVPDLCPAPRVPDLRLIETAFETRAERATLGLETPEEAMAAAHREIESILAKRRSR